MGNPYEDFAARVNTDIATNGLESAYKHFHSAIDLALAGNTFAQKEAEWTKYARALETSGALPKLGAEFLIENGAALDKADGKVDGVIHKEALQHLASVTTNPIYKELDDQALKQFDTAASLHHSDGVIDQRELASCKDRQSMPSRESFANGLADRVMKSIDSPADAAGKLQAYMGMRSAMETPAEKEETWNAVLKELEKRDGNVIGKLSMGWMKNNIDYIVKPHAPNQPVEVSLPDLEKFAQSPFPMTRTFGQYLKKEFVNIASLDGYTDLNRISAREIQIYENKMQSNH